MVAKINKNAGEGLSEYRKGKMRKCITLATVNDFTMFFGEIPQTLNLLFKPEAYINH
jgi:hypothetical protein